jgi:SAM-dependent methyltransferase
VADLQFTHPTLAALYDSLSPRAERSDFDFYLSLALAARSVLDVGCGTGSFLREVRAAGHAGRLCGIDPAAGMIGEARRTDGIEWHRGELPDAGFRAAFDLVVMAGHAFQVLLGDDELRRFLAAVRAALTADGCFAFETRNPGARAWERWADYCWPTVVGLDGEPVEVRSRIERPFDGNTVTFSQTYVSPAWPEPHVSPSTLRFLDRDTLNAFLREARLTVTAQYGDWDRSPVTATSPEIITLARPN